CTGYAKIVQAIGVAAGAAPAAPAAPERPDARAVVGRSLRRVDADEKVTGGARELPGVLAVLTQADMPPARFGAFTQDETALADSVVRYVGEGVAAVIAIDEDTARAALDLI